MKACTLRQRINTGICLLTVIGSIYFGQLPATAGVVVSQVVTTADGKGYLQVDSQPMNFLAVQNNGTTQFQGHSNLPLGWLENMYEKTQAAGYGIVSQRLTWGDIEPVSEGTFDWTVIDNYVAWAKKYNLRIDLVWFGSICMGGGLLDAPETISGGTVVRCLPDYVRNQTKYFNHGLLASGAYAPFLPSHSADAANLFAWEQYAVLSLFYHLAATDTTHRVILFQVYNEPNQHPDWSTTEFQQNVLDKLASMVKVSPYVVATRVNLTWASVYALPNAPNVDFVGADPYTSDYTQIASLISQTGASKLNYIAENSGSCSNLSHLMATALVNGGFYDSWELTNQAVNDGVYTPSVDYGSWAVGTIPALNPSSQSALRLMTGLSKFSTIMATAPVSSMAGFNLESTAGYGAWKTVGAHSIGFQDPAGDQSVGIMVQSGAFTYVVSDTASSVTIVTGSLPSNVSQGHIASGVWVTDGPKSIINWGNGTYGITYNANECLRFQL